MGSSGSKEKEIILEKDIRIEGLEKTLEKVFLYIEKLETGNNEITKHNWQSGGSRLDQILGLEHVRNILKANCVLTAVQPQLFKPIGNLERVNKILLYGPPGTGKTLLAESAAKDANCTFRRIEISEIGSEYYFVVEREIRSIFSMAKSNKKNTILFMDEIDSLGRKRTSREDDFMRSKKNTLLQELDKLSHPDASHIIFIACTNYLDQLDNALLRRFDVQLYVNLPDRDTRKKLIKLFLVPDTLPDEEISEVADKTQFYSGADIQKLIRKARQVSLEECMSSKYFKQQPDGKYVSCTEGETGAEERSLLNIPNGCAASPPPLNKQHILCSLPLVPRATKVEDVLRGVPDHDKKRLRQELATLKRTTEERFEQCDMPLQEMKRIDKKQMLIDAALKVFDQPPEKVNALTNYKVAPEGINPKILHYFFDDDDSY